MTSFYAIQYYSSLLVLIAGLATFLGFLGLGIAVLRIFSLKIPPPWLHVTGVLLGIELVSLVVQLTGMVGMASRSFLIAFWGGLVALGGATAIRSFCQFRSYSNPNDRNLSILPLSIGIIAILSNLLVAIAPSTKIDEIFYHMLLPSRIVTDGALQFYRLPWEAAILPQMIYPIALTPLHAINCPDAGNVISWALNLTMLWFAWCLLRESAKSTTWTFLWIISLVIGLHASVWNVTGGSHSMGELAMAAGVVAFCLRQQLMTRLSSTAFACMFSILLLSAASSKVSLLPISAMMLFLMSIFLFRQSSKDERWYIALALAAPWLFLLLPLALWTFWKSGSPFGPMFSDIFPKSVYDVQSIGEILQKTKLVNRPPLLTIVKNTLINYSPLLWFGVAGFFFNNQISRVTRLAGALLLVMQLTLIYLFLPYDVRFLGGVHYGLLICFALTAAQQIHVYLMSRRTLLFIICLLVLPWLGAQIFYCKRFFPVSLGLQSKSEFCERYVAFYGDYQKLDRILPKDAVLLVTDFRLSSVYAPRPIYMDTADLPQSKEAFLFANSTSDATHHQLKPSYRIGEKVYQNLQAVTETYRMSYGTNLIGPLYVKRIHID